jgi:hypothetical protein
MAYSNRYYSSNYYSNLWPRPQFQNGEVVVDNIKHKVGNEWSSIAPGSTDNTGTLILSGYANAYATIEIYDNGKLILTVEAGRLGTWNANLSSVISSGDHNFMIKQAGYDFAPGEPINIVIEGNDTAIPVEITQIYDDVGIHKGVLNQGNTTDDARPTFTGKGPANSKIIIIDEYNNTIAQGNTDRYGNWQVTPDFAIADGNYNFRAFVNGEFSTGINLTINTAPPQEKLAFTGAFDYLTSDIIPENGKTNDLRPNFSGKATPGSFIYLFVEGNNEPIGGAVTNASGFWNINTFKDLQPGTQTLEVRGDNQFAQFTLTVGAQSVIEPLTINHLIDGQTFDLIPEQGQSSDTTPWISGKSEPYSNVVLLEGSKFLGYVQADAQGKWLYEISTALEAGQHAVTAYSDNQISAPFTFVIAAPQVPGGYKGWSSFSLNEATDVYDTNDQAELALSDLLVNEEASLFAQNIALQEAATLTLTQDELAKESQSVGVEINAANLSATAIEEPQYMHFA